MDDTDWTLKRIFLPPTNLKGIETYLRNKRYRINPSLQDSNPDAVLTFDKPLPDGRRLHGAVYERKTRFEIRRHIDKCDPFRDPIGHLLEDCTVDIPDDVSFIPKMKNKRKTKQRKRRS